LQGKEIKFNALEDFPRLADLDNLRPKIQWWMDLRHIAKVLAQPAPQIPPPDDV
jgi:hypothetical protein